MGLAGRGRRRRHARDQHVREREAAVRARRHCLAGLRRRRQRCAFTGASRERVTPHRHGPAPPQGHQTPAGWMLAPAGRLLAGMLRPPPLGTTRLRPGDRGGRPVRGAARSRFCLDRGRAVIQGNAARCSGRRRRLSGRTARLALSGNCSAPGRSSCAWPEGPPGPPGPPSHPKHCLTQAGRAWRHPTPTPGRSAHQAPHKA